MTLIQKPNKYKAGHAIKNISDDMWASAGIDSEVK